MLWSGSHTLDLAVSPVLTSATQILKSPLNPEITWIPSRKLHKLKTHNTKSWKYLDFAFRRITRDNPMHELPELPWVTPHVTPDESSPDESSSRDFGNTRNSHT